MCVDEHREDQLDRQRIDAVALELFDGRLEEAFPRWRKVKRVLQVYPQRLLKTRDAPTTNYEKGNNKQQTRKKNNDIQNT